MNYKDAYNDLISGQINRKNRAYAHGWRNTTDVDDIVNGRVTITNVKTGEAHTGQRQMLKSGEYDRKRVKWND